MKILVIGNSHSASLKQGFDQTPDFPKNVELSWFTSAGREFYRLNYNKNNRTIGLRNPDENPEAKQILVNRNGAARISIEPFDRILIAGHSNGFVEIATLLGQFGVETVHANPQMPILTHDGFIACLDRIIASRIPKWGPTETGIPVDMIPSPRLTDDLERYEDSAPVFGFCKELRKEGQSFHALLTFAEERYAARALEAGIHVFRQPAETVSTQTGLTVGDYHHGNKNIRGRQQIADGRHTNVEYGLLTSRDYLNFIATASNAVAPSRPNRRGKFAWSNLRNWIQSNPNR